MPIRPIPHTLFQTKEEVIDLMIDPYRQQQFPTQGTPFGSPGGFPGFPGIPGFPGQQGRIDRLEREVNRLQREVERLDNRVRRIERRLGL
jgi:hypothetical protein